MHYLIISIIVLAYAAMGCEGKTGPAGPSGSDGIAGASGQSGNQGNQGVKGDKGDTGPEGPQGDKGDTGPAGPEGPMGPQGDPGETGIPTDIPGNILADIHHIKLIQDDKDPDDVDKIEGPQFNMNIPSISLLVDETTTFVGKAATQSGDPLPVEFGWESADPIIASVDNGTIMGERRGTTEITVSVVGRGIELTIPVTVHNPVKGVVLALETEGTSTTQKSGVTIFMTATAYDAKNNDDATNDGNEVTGVSFTWSSSNSSAASVKVGDDDPSSRGSVTTEGSGSADIQAHIGEIASNKIKVTGFSIDTPTRRLVVDTSNQPYSGELNEAGDAWEQGSENIVIMVTLQQQGLDDMGELTWTNLGGQEITFVSQNMDAVSIDGMATTAQTTGLATMQIEAADVAEGTAVITIDAEYAGARYVEVTITQVVAATNGG